MVEVDGKKYVLKVVYIGEEGACSQCDAASSIECHISCRGYDPCNDCDHPNCIGCEWFCHEWTLKEAENNDQQEG